MTLSHFIAILTAISLNANPSPHAIPTVLPLVPAPASVSAPVPEPPLPPVKKQKTSLGVHVTSKSAIVVDVSSGAVLFAKDATMQRPIASLTKLMTAMTVLDQGLRGEETVTLQLSDFEETSVFKPGDTMTRQEAFKAMLVGSVNEIANAFARTAPDGRTAFLEAMRKKSNVLGLQRAAFEDVTGVNAKTRASAADVATMMRSALGYPDIRDAGSSGSLVVKTAEGRTVNVKPTNLLLSSYLAKDPYRIVLGKTGSLPEAGFCMAQTTENVDGHQIIVVTLGSMDHFSRFQDIKAMTAWTFDAYAWK